MDEDIMERKIRDLEDRLSKLEVDVRLLEKDVNGIKDYLKQLYNYIQIIANR